MRTLSCFLQSLTQSCLFLVAEHLVGLQEQDIFTERAWELPRVSRAKPGKVSRTGRDLPQPGDKHSCPCSAGDPVSKLGTVCVPWLRLLQSVANVKRQLCSVYRQLFLTSAGHSLSQGLRDRAQKLMR